MPLDFENLDSYEVLEEILKWKRTKPKRNNIKEDKCKLWKIQ